MKLLHVTACQKEPEHYGRKNGLDGLHKMTDPPRAPWDFTETKCPHDAVRGKGAAPCSSTESGTEQMQRYLFPFTGSGK